MRDNDTNNLIICNPVDLKTLREIVNNDLLLRNTYIIKTDWYIPRGMIFHMGSDSIKEIDEIKARLPHV